MTPNSASQTGIKEFGITEIYKTPNSEVDIIFVHGLNGHPFHTWSADNAGRTFWPRDLLPSVLLGQKVRILVYGYNGSVKRGGDDVSSGLLHHSAEQLVASFYANRSLRNALRHPIIFVCHSFGGLVVKRALLYSESLQNVHSEHLRSIYISTFGILFLSTPHFGIQPGNWDAFSDSDDTNTRRLGELISSSGLASSLRWNSETLQNVNRLFADKMSKFRIFFLHETIATTSKSGAQYFVSEISAAPCLPGVERTGIEADHIHMPKFGDIDSPGFEVLAEAILRYCKEARDVISKRWFDEASDSFVRRKRQANELFGPTGENSVRADSDIGDCWNIQSADSDLPIPQNIQFIGRQDELRQVDDFFLEEPTCSRILLLYGTGGIGKSQIALRYAYTTARKALAIFWVDASSRILIEFSLTAIARSIVKSLVLHYGEEIATKKFGLADAPNLLSQDPKSPHAKQDIIRALRNWLGKPGNGGWLLIFDNYDDIDDFDVQEYFPASNHSRILVTSRRPDLDRVVTKSLEVTNLDDQSALQLLLAGNKMHTPEDAPITPSVNRILKMLSNLPLAIVQANAYINNRKLSMDEFLQQYEKQFKVPMGKKPRGSWLYGHVVLTTWKISLTAVQAEDPLAAETFFTCSLLNNGNIMPEMLCACLPGITDRQHMQECFEVLSSYSLIRQQWTDGRFWIHPVVHKWARVIQSMKDLSRRSASVLRGLINIGSPIYNSSTKYLEQDILPHANFFILHALPCLQPQTLEIEDLNRLRGLHSLAQEKCSVKIAGIVCLKALECSRYFSIPAVELVTLYLGLSTCLRRSGWRSVAETIQKAVECMLGQENALELPFLLSSAYREYVQGHLTEAESHCRKLLVRLQRTVAEGEDLTQSVLQAEFLLAKILMRHKAGPKFFEGMSHAYELMQKIIGTKIYTNYPESLEIVAGFGELLESHGQRHKAHVFYSNSIQLMINTDMSQARTQKWLRKLCRLLFLIGRFSEVEVYLRWLLKRVSATRSDEKRDLLRQLSVTLSRQEKFEELESVARQLLESEREAFLDGGDVSWIIHPTVYLCSALFQTGRRSEAVRAGEESLALHHKISSANEANTAFLRTFLEELRKGNLPKWSFHPSDDTGNLE